LISGFKDDEEVGEGGAAKFISTDTKGFGPLVLGRSSSKESLGLKP